MGAIGRLVQLHANYYLLRRPPVIVYSMERTGSVALYHSLVAHGVFALATHYLDPNKIELLSGSARWASRHIVAKRKPVKIISLVRNPIENMASVFARSTYANPSQRHEPCDDAADRDPASRFVAEFLESKRYERQLTWFDREFNVALGLNVYDYPFDKARGCVHFDEGPFGVLIIRTEMSDEDKSEVVRKFLNLPRFEMVQAEAAPRRTDGRVAPGVPGEQAVYSAQYKQLKQSLSIPEPHRSALLQSRFVQHFFTPAQLAAQAGERD